jgi:hypothetical protein
MGSPPPDRDPRPKLALMSAPDPSAQIQQVFYCFIGECFVKNSNPNYIDQERKGKNTFNFFSENWVSQGPTRKLSRHLFVWVWSWSDNKKNSTLGGSWFTKYEYSLILGLRNQVTNSLLVITQPDGS